MKKKVVLFHPNPFSATRPYYGAPLGLLAISRVLDKEGYEIKIIHPVTHKKFKQAVVEECEGAICLGISSITGYQIQEGREVAQEVKKQYPDLPIVWGGWHPSILPRETVKDEYVDIVVKGQAERSFTELVHCLEDGGDLKKVKGLTYKDNGAVVDNPPAPLESLDNFPPLPYHLIDVEKFLNNQEYGRRSLNYYTSYGCPHRCGFCVEEIVTKRGWTSLSAERMVDELEDMKRKYDIDSVAIIDSNFFTNKNRVRRMCELMLERGVNLKWGNVNGRTATLKKYEDELWGMMKKSGMECILTGAESGDQETLDYMLKDIDAGDVIEMARFCSKYDIKVLCSYLVGFPWSTEAEVCQKKVDEEIRASLNQIKELFDIHPRFRFMFALYLPYPSTTLFSKARSLGIDIPENFGDWSKFLIAAEDVNKLKVRQKWVREDQARFILMLSIYIFFFLDPDSYDLIGDKIKSRAFKALYFVAFNLYKGIVRFRWKHMFFRFPVDFYFYNYLRKYSRLG